MIRHCAIAAALWAGAAPAADAAGPPGPLTLQEATTLAVDSDPWLGGSRQREQALAQEAVAARALPDPRLSLLAGNLPVDSFELGQEAMTQLAVGVSQRFPRGASRRLAGRQREELADAEGRRRAERRAQLRRRVSLLWLDLYRAQESIRLVEDDRPLFEQLLAITRSSYAITDGATGQQDLIRAQLEMTRLEDRVAALAMARDAAREQLAQWVGPAARRPLATPGTEEAALPAALAGTAGAAGELYSLLQGHPALQAHDRRIAALDTAAEIARQGLRPEWRFSAQYGYRDDDPFGDERADLFTVGVSIDLPLFTADRARREADAAVARAAALRSERQLLLRQLVAELKAALARLRRLEERQALYASALLPQMEQRAEAALAAYHSDRGDFAEALRARIAVLDTRIEALELDVERRRSRASIDYLLAGSGPAVQAGQLQGGQ